MKKKIQKYKLSQLFKFIWSYVRKYKGLFYFLSILVLLSNLVDAITPYIFGKIVDAFIGESLIFGLSIKMILLIWALMIVLRIVCNRISMILIVKLEVYSQKNVTNDLLAKLLNLPIRYHYDQKPGEVFKKVDRASNALNDFIDVFLFNFAPSLLKIIFAVVLMLYINWQLALINIITVIAFFIFAAVYKLEAGLKIRKQVNHQYNTIFGNIGDALANIFAVKSNTAEKYEVKKLNREFNKTIDLVNEQTKIYTQVNVGQAIISNVGQILTVILGSLLMYQKVITPGDFIVFLGYITLIYGPLWWMSGQYRWLKRMMVDIGDADKIFKTSDEADYPGSINKNLTGTIEFKNVSFKYPERNEGILDRVNFKIDAGGTLAIFGATGSGKTTLYNLLLRLYEQDSGQVLYDDFDAKKITLNFLRQQIAVVPQNPVLFNESIFDNIRYSRPEATKEEVLNAAKVANAHDFIMRMPKKYQSKVGERGVKLSGGQVQRIAIARAVLRNPKILILDEATSSLDQKTKFEVLAALQNLIKGRTTIIITHDFSAITKSADNIIVLDKGKILQSGSHDHLLSVPGIYRDLYYTQQEHLK